MPSEVYTGYMSEVEGSSQQVKKVKTNDYRNMMRWLLVLFSALFLPLNASADSSELVDLQESKVQLLSSMERMPEGTEILLGVHITLAPGWHTYTYDPGDAGIPLGMEWQLPEGAEISETYWPPYSQYDEAGLTTYGYSDEVVFTFKLKTPAKPAELSMIHADIGYLVCEEICIPQTAKLSLELPRGNHPQSKHAIMLADWHKKSKLAKAWEEKKDGSSPKHHNSSSQRTLGPYEGNASIDKIPAYAGTTHGNIIIESHDNYSLLTILLFALIGGLILNLMPCVFPVLSLKALAIAKHADSHPGEVRKEGIAYTLGVLTCFWVLAGILIGLQEAGDAIGWGFQFQSPTFVAIMALLLFFIGLNLSGLFELPVLFGNLAMHLGGEQHSARESYFIGLLAALVATPCTAPFMATAIGFALTQTAATSLLVFTALGLGLALPFILISYFPASLKRLPKPGAWMDTFKKFLAFPMYLTTIWLLWILGTQAGGNAIIATLLVGTVITFLMWAKGHCSFKSHFCTVANLLIVLALLFVLSDGLNKLQKINIANQAGSQVEAVPFSHDRLAYYRAKNTPVFINATASWCITCQVNYRVAINDQKVQQAFQENGVTYMVADWTNRNDEITKYLSSYGYKGVPLYVYYAPGKNGIVLPQILTPTLILETIAPSR